MAIGNRNLGNALNTIVTTMPEWDSLQEYNEAMASDQNLDAALTRANALLGRVSSAKEQDRQAKQCTEEYEGLLCDFAHQHLNELIDEETVGEVQGKGEAECLELVLASLRQLTLITQDEVDMRERRTSEIVQNQLQMQTLIQENNRQVQEHTQVRPIMNEEESLESLKASVERLEQETNTLASRKGALGHALELDKGNRKMGEELQALANAKREEYQRWDRLNQRLGDASGSKFRKIAQSFVLDSLLHTANTYLRTLTERYSLHVEPGSFVITLADAYQGYASRASSTLSGGESFLVSLSLALALSDIGSHLSVDTLFIDEGFGTLSGEPLQNAISTLRSLHSRASRHVGIISHVEELKESIPVQIQVRQEGYNAVSTIVVTG